MRSLFTKEKTEERKRKFKEVFGSQEHLIREPFFFEGDNGKGIILIHGWTSTSYEVRKLGEFLNSKGYTVNGILLSGHGKTPEELEKVKVEQWTDDIQRSYEKIKEKCDKVFIAGTSLGGNLALNFCAKNPDINGVIAMATPYKIKMEWLVNLCSKLSLLIGRRNWNKYYPKSFGSSGLVTRVVSYQKYPVINGIEAYKAIRFCRNNLSKIKCPCLVMQSTHDHIVIPKSIEKIYKGVGSENKRKKYIQKAYHTFIADIDNEHIFEDILNFLNEN